MVSSTSTNGTTSRAPAARAWQIVVDARSQFVLAHKLRQKMNAKLFF
jgi:hypothetical protein